jgi:hypothetical protein
MVSLLNAKLQDALRAPAIVRVFEFEGFAVEPGSAAAFERRIATDRRAWLDIVRTAGGRSPSK